MDQKVMDRLPNVAEEEAIAERLAAYEASQTAFPVTLQQFLGNGYLVYGLGTRGFLSLEDMPWRYQRSEFWLPIARKLVGQRLFCTLKSIVAPEPGKPDHRFIASARNHGYPLNLLVPGQRYKATVLYINERYAALELGGSFAWEYGSVFGVQRKYGFPPGTFKGITPGMRVPVVFQRYIRPDIAHFSEKPADTLWYDCRWLRHVGSVKHFEVKKKPRHLPELWLDGYEGKLDLGKDLYGSDLPYLLAALKKLPSGAQLEVRIVQYQPDNQHIGLQLTELQADELIEDEKLEWAVVARRYERLADEPATPHYTFVKNGSGYAILELGVQINAKTRVATAGIAVPNGPFGLSYRIWTPKTAIADIVEDFFSYQQVDASLVTYVGGQPATERHAIADLWKLLVEKDFLGGLADMLTDHDGTMSRQTHADGSIDVMNDRFHVLFTQTKPTQFTDVDWWLHPAYATRRYVLVYMPADQPRPVRIDIDHHRLVLGPQVRAIAPVLQAAWSILQTVMAEDAV